MEKLLELEVQGPAPQKLWVEMDALLLSLPVGAKLEAFGNVGADPVTLWSYSDERGSSITLFTHDGLKIVLDGKLLDDCWKAYGLDESGPA